MKPKPKASHAPGKFHRRNKLNEAAAATDSAIATSINTGGGRRIPSAARPREIEWEIVNADTIFSVSRIALRRLGIGCHESPPRSNTAGKRRANRNAR